MRRRTLLLFVALILATSGVAYAAGVNGAYKGKDIVKVTLDGKTVKPEKVPGYLEDGYTMVPLGMLRQMGITVEWNQKTLTANVKLPPPTVRTVPVLTKPQLEQLSEYVYKIEGSTNDPNIVRQGSGFVLNGTLITAAHVAADSTTLRVKVDGQWQTVGAQQFINKTTDVKGYTINGGKELPVSTELPQPGDPVYSLSFPKGILAITEGVVNEIMPVNGVMQIKHSADTDGGSSGGILVSGTGKIIGLHSSGMDVDGVSINYAIPIKNVIDLLNK